MNPISPVLKVPRRAAFSAILWATLPVLISAAQASTIFSANFDNSSLTGAQNAVTSSSQLGAPATGTWAGTAAFQGRIAVGATYPARVTADSGAGSVLIAEFSTAGRFSLAGEATTIGFEWGGFGNNNTGGFKYDFVAGFDSSGNQVF